jgi:hypothetical protein
VSECPSDAANALADLIVVAQSELATPHALGCGLLREDSHAAVLSAAEISDLVEAALADGEALARQVRQRWGDNADGIAAANRIPVEDSEADGGYGTAIVFAQYRTRPLGIVLHRPPIDALEWQLQQSALGRLLDIQSVRAVFLAHELYHHFDETRSPTLCSRHRVPVLRLGRLCLTAPVAGLREIAAGAFAQRLLGLRFHPRLLDIAALSWPRLEAAAVHRSDAVTTGPSACRTRTPHRSGC